MYKTIIICDYPSKYTFPSFGFGSAEKRIWSFARTVSNMEGFRVIITGPLWLPEYLPKATHFKKRLDIDSCEEFFTEFGKVDYLFAGHEYFDNENYVNSFLKVADKIFTFQGNNYEYKEKSFDARKKFLFCYSDQMKKKYEREQPFKVLSYHSGVDEVCYLTVTPKSYLVWIGRIDKDKAPHYAILASKKVGLPLYVLGEPKYQKEYQNNFLELFQGVNVIKKGVVYGPEKMKLLSEAICGIYTLDREYTEAGAGVLGEMLRSGIPIAAISWVGNDAVCEAIDDARLGKVTKLKGFESDEDIAQIIAENIEYCLKLDRKKIFEIANQKYDPTKLALKMFEIIDKT